MNMFYQLLIDFLQDTWECRKEVSARTSEMQVSCITNEMSPVQAQNVFWLWLAC